MTRIDSQADSRVLKRLTPIGQLSPDAIRDLARKAVVKKVSAGTRLFNANEVDDWTVYVLDGTVELLSEREGPETVVGGTSRAEMPLAPQQPRQVSARARTDVELIRIPSSLMEVLLQPPGGGESEVRELGGEDDEPDNQLLCDIFQDYVADRLEVPALPNVALRIRKAVEDPDVKVADVVSIVTADAAIAARLVQVANSPSYRGHSSVANCRDAIVRLGLGTTKELVSAIALKGLFRATSPLLRQRMLELWRHSTHVAAISTLLGKRSRRINPDLALLAGLVHDIGVVSILDRAQRYPDLLSDPRQLNLTVAKLRAQVSAMILRKWDFADEVVTAALEAEDWTRDGSDHPDCADIVLIAQILSFVGTPRFVELPPLPSLPAFKRLELQGMGPQECLALIDEAGNAIADLHRALSG